MPDSANHESKSNRSSSSPERTALPGTSNLHQKPLYGRVLITLGVLIQMIGVVGILIFVPLGESDAESYFLMLPNFLQNIIAIIPEGTPIILLALPGGLLFIAGRIVAKRGKRHLARVYQTNELHAIKAPILYLRPFVSDESPAQFVRSLSQGLFPLLNKRVRTWNRLEAIEGVTRFEELLAYAFKELGPFVAIGDPKEDLPLLGATRIYAETQGSAKNVDEEDWKMEVERQIACAQLILLHAGISEGLRWEIRRVVQLADPRRVVLCVNPERKLRYGFRNLSSKALRAEIQEIWRSFKTNSEADFPSGLPEEIGDARFINFDSDWNPRPLEPTKQKLVWFMPGLSPDLSRKTIDSALVWLSWMMVPETFGRTVLRNFINYVSFVLIFIVVIMLFIFSIGAVNDFVSN